jgi:hypothetical protein
VKPRENKNNLTFRPIRKDSRKENSTKQPINSGGERKDDKTRAHESRVSRGKFPTKKNVREFELPSVTSVQIGNFNKGIYRKDLN